MPVPINKLVNRQSGPHDGKLVNRAPGLYSKGEGVDKEAPKPKGKPKVDCFSDDLLPLVVPIESMVPDPNNARLHPDKNLDAIKQSLSLYGQVKPLVARKSDRVVLAGNGTLEAAKELGWSKIAVSFAAHLDEVEGVGYGLADNRTAELAKWDFEVVARLDRLLQESQHTTIGWSMDELEVLRAAEWLPPEVSDEEIGGKAEEPTEHTCPACGHKWSE